MTTADAEIIAFESAARFEAWLEDHADEQAGVWLEIAKAGSCTPSLTSDEAVDVGLCFGWISGQRKSLDEDRYLQKYVPRRRRSRWSQVNVRRVEALIASGRMRPRGLAEVHAAQQDGRWGDAYAPQREAQVPSDLARELAAHPAAATAFASLGRTRRYAVIHGLLVMRSPDGRARKLARTVADLCESVEQRSERP